MAAFTNTFSIQRKIGSLYSDRRYTRNSHQRYWCRCPMVERRLHDRSDSRHCQMKLSRNSTTWIMRSSAIRMI
jgi:hypothetical protein